MRIVSVIITVIAVAVINLGCDSMVKKDAVALTPPPVIDPGQECGQPPANAIVLFDGKDFSQWQSPESIVWKIQDGYMEVARTEKDKHQGIQTARGFGDCQLHVEFATPSEVIGEGQGRGNSGVFLMGQYEVQILDSYNNPTYPDGQAGAIYKQSVPMFNVCRKPGQWQAYDIVFRRPHFDAKGKLVKPAVVTVLHNGVVIQDNFILQGITYHAESPKYIAHADKLPIMLQDHGNPTRFRNIWVVELPERN